MGKYIGQKAFLIAVDCIVFGFDGRDIKLLLIRRDFEPEKNKWSLMGGFLKPKENLEEAANRILKQLTGLEGVYMEQLRTFSEVTRDPQERTISIAYVALIDINRYQEQMNELYHAEWFLINEKPKLIFDHDEIVAIAKKQLQYKAAIHPLLFELLPEKFTISQIQTLYEEVYESLFDVRNFSRKLMSSGFLIKQTQKDKSSSKKGAFYYKLNKKKYKTKQATFLNLVPKVGKTVTTPFANPM